METKKVLCHNCKYLDNYSEGHYRCTNPNNSILSKDSPLDGKKELIRYEGIYKCNKNLDCQWWEKGDPKKFKKSIFESGIWWIDFCLATGLILFVLVIIWIIFNF